jgi:hypothetical protein
MMIKILNHNKSNYNNKLKLKFGKEYKKVKKTAK